MNRRRRWTLAAIERRLADVVAHARPIIEKKTLEEEAEWLAAHPAKRSCYLCKRTHRNPRRITVVQTDGRHVVRWVSTKCLSRRLPVGPPVHGFQHVVIHARSR